MPAFFLNAKARIAVRSRGRYVPLPNHRVGVYKVVNAVSVQCKEVFYGGVD